MIFSARFMLPTVCALSLLTFGCNNAPTPEQLTESSSKSSNQSSDRPSKKPTTPPVIPTNLTIGDPAPALQIAKWVQGSPVTDYQTEKVYVVEFWATWCGPCRAGMPHISELQETYGDEVAFVGVTREDIAVVQTFLNTEADERIAKEPGKPWSDLMRYTVAIDNDSITNKSFMKAAGERGIPTAFIVGFDGKVEWIGHPMKIDEPLKKITARNWDRDVAIAEREKEQELAARQQEFSKKLSQAFEDKNWDQALSLLDEYTQDMPDSPMIQSLRLDILIEAKRTEQSLQLLDELAEKHAQDADRLNALAWSIASKESRQEQLLQKALQLAEQAGELTDFADANILDTMARVYFELGDLEQAINWQARAVEASPSNVGLQKTLEKYTAKKDATDSADEAEVPKQQPAASDTE